MVINKDLRHSLLGKGYKLTRQRKAILKVLSGGGQHLTAEEIHQQVQLQCPDLNLVTVYRNLNLLAGMGVIGRVDFGDGRARFEARADIHHHLFCLRCGRVVEISSCPACTDTSLEGRHQFRVTGHRFEVYGYCIQCDSAPRVSKGGEKQ